jgi:N-acetylglucosamine kinase-like BadF-type ATPase
LTDFFIQHTGAKDIDDLIEGLYVGRYHPFDRKFALQVFKIAESGDPEALNVLRWAGRELGDMACGVIRQLNLQTETFDIVMIGSIFKGHSLIRETLATTVHQVASHATLVHLMAPPVVGAVLLGMEQVGVDGYIYREKLIESTRSLSDKDFGS